MLDMKNYYNQPEHQDIQDPSVYEPRPMSFKAKAALAAAGVLALVGLGVSVKDTDVHNGPNNGSETVDTTYEDQFRTTEDPINPSATTTENGVVIAPNIEGEHTNKVVEE